jgi:hypothetical protein
MSDLSSLMQIAPYAGTYMAGQQNVADLAQKNAETQRLQQLIQSLQIANQQSQTMNPLLVQHQSLQNQGLEAGLPGIQAESSKKQSEAKLKAGTLDSDIEAGNSANQTKLTQDKVKQIQATGQLLYGAGAFAMNAEGPGGAKLAVADFLKQHNIPLDHPGAQMTLNMSPQQMMQYGETMMKHSEDYLKSIDTEKLRADSHLKGVGMQVQGQKDVEQMRIDAGKYKKADKSRFENYFSTLKTSRDKHAALVDEATKARLGGDMSTAANFMARAEALRPQAEAEISAINPKPGTVDLSKIGGDNTIPTNAKPSIAPQVTGEGGPSAAGQAQVPNPQHIAALRANPSAQMKAFFDQKFGSGAADKILNGK